MTFEDLIEMSKSLPEEHREWVVRSLDPVPDGWKRFIVETKDKAYYGLGATLEEACGAAMRDVLCALMNRTSRLKRELEELNTVIARFK